jgi:predicted enzyme related to lactoylglutathione lyase
MRAFYEGCFALKPVDAHEAYVVLESDIWRLTLVETAEARPKSSPATRRENTPVKLSFGVADIDALRPRIASLGGRTDREWRFGDAVHCDCIDPEGNVLQLVQSA